MNNDANQNIILECRELIANTSPLQYCGNGLNLAAPKGAIVGFTGTYYKNVNEWLKTLGGLYYPLEGQLFYYAEDTKNFNAVNWGHLRKKVSYVTEDSNLLSMLNGLANVMLPGDYHQLHDSETIKNKALDLITQLGLEEMMNNLPADMAKEQRFLFSVARALMMEPDILFLENPFFMLDTYSDDLLKQFLLLQVLESHLTVFISTQDCHFIEYYAEQMVFFTPQETLTFNNYSDFINHKNSYMEDFFGKTVKRP